MEIDAKQEVAKYQAERDNLISQFQQVEQQRNLLIQAIQERNGILAYLDSLNHTSNEKINTKQS